MDAERSDRGPSRAQLRSGWTRLVFILAFTLFRERHDNALTLYAGQRLHEWAYSLAHGSGRSTSFSSSRCTVYGGRLPLEYHPSTKGWALRFQSRLGRRARRWARDATGLGRHLSRRAADDGAMQFTVAGTRPGRPAPSVPRLPLGLPGVQF